MIDIFVEMMKFLLSRKDIRFLSYVNFFYAVLGFCPYYIFKKDNKLVELSRIRYVSLAVLISIGIAQIVSFYPMVTLNFRNFHLWHKIFACAIVLLNIFFYSLCFSNWSASSRRKWKKMLSLFLKIDIVLRNRNKLNKNVFSNFNIQVFILHIFFIFVAVLRCTYYKNRSLYMMLNHSTNILGFYYPYSYTFFLCNICLAIKSRFEDAAALLKAEKREIHCSKNSNIRIKRIISIIKFVFQANNEIIVIFNDLVGWTILTVLMRTIAVTLGYLDAIFAHRISSSDLVDVSTISSLMATLLVIV